MKNNKKRWITLAVLLAISIVLGVSAGLLDDFLHIAGVNNVLLQSILEKLAVGLALLAIAVEFVFHFKIIDKK